MSDYVLGGVALEIVGTLTLPPAQPVEDPPAWPTDLLDINTPVVMLNGSLWRVLRRPEAREDPRILVELRHPQKASQRVSLLVPLGEESTPIWNTGQPLPEPPPPPGPEPIPVEPPPFEPPVSPQDPVAPSETAGESVTPPVP